MFHFINRKVIGIIVGVFLIAFLGTVYAGLYFLGYARGYAEGRRSERKLSIESPSSQQASSTVTILVTPTSGPKTISYPTKASWGGPDLWEAVNKRRKELGVNPLTTASELCTIASIRLNELLELGKLDGHEGFTTMPDRRPDLKWIFEKYSNVAEFLAVGGDTAEETVGLWENTLGHSKLLNGGEFVWGCIYAQNTFAVAIAAY